MFRIFVFCAIAGCLIFLSSCNGNSAQQKLNLKDTIPPGKKMEMDPSIRGNFSTQTKIHFDSIELKLFFDKYDSLKVYKKELKEFYLTRDFAYAWFDQKGLIEQSGDLYNRVLHIEEDGLPQEQPYLSVYKRMMEGEKGLNTSGDPETELMITSQYMAYAHKAWSGLPESSSRKLEWYVPRKKLDYHLLLDSLLNINQNNTAKKDPVYRQYNLLKTYLKRFREIESKGSWITFKADRKKYVEGDSSATIRLIRKKLFLAGDISEDNGSPIFDAAMTYATKRYQQRYGLKEDGIVGAGIIREMNTPISFRIKQLIVNMERCRWIEDDPTGNYLVVNIPQFQLLVYENDSLAWTCNVVVGKELNKTVIFQGKMQQIVFSPYWNVPTSILNKEILPAIEKHPDYLRKHNMEWYDGKVRQKPGPDNSLGRVKFLFPNNFRMYLHDTPAKSLFLEEKRTFSHGCIRIAEPRKLALYLLREDINWPESRVDEAMKSGKEQYVTLKKQIPVSIVYFTAWVDRNGKINFRDDIYQRDSRLMEALFAKK